MTTAGSTGALTAVPVGALAPERFEHVLPADAFAAFQAGTERAREAFAGRAIWNVNSTARGGGVAEMLVSLLAYARGAGIDARWSVIAGDEGFFHVTKRLHNHLHGSPGDGGALDDEARGIYERALAPNAEDLGRELEPGDIVILHDPQTAGLIPTVRAAGVPVIWRCHIGVDTPNDITKDAWRFLQPYVRQADAVVFSREAFVWDVLGDVPVHVIAPSIDAFSPKNQELSTEQVDAILDVATLVAGTGADHAHATFHRIDGSPGRVHRPAQVWQEAPLAADDAFLLQVSRWDRLKDPMGVIDGFLEHVANHCDAHLVYAGPAVEAVSDDPEGKEVLDEARERWESLPGDLRARVHLAALPMDDLEENAAIVNALQRRANVVAQKSLAEGFGLTVAEAMWKGRPVVASRVGGIQEQIEDGRSGRLLPDPNDLATFGQMVSELLTDPARADRMGEEARSRVRDEFLAVRHLLQYIELLAPMTDGSKPSGRFAR
jgi:trehalose synthase